MVSLTMTARGYRIDGERAGEFGAQSAGPRVETARGRPPSPVIGAGYIWAMQLISFGSLLMQQWACS